jgi:predicted RNA-binding Zn ribbon-like protein
MTEHSEAPERFDVIAGAVCLDFANTVGGRRGGEAREHVPTYAALVEWGREVGVLAPDDAARLEQQAVRRRDEAGAVLARAVALREAIYALFAARLEGRESAAQDLASLNAELGRALHHMVVASTPDGFTWQWTRDEEALDPMLWRVARSAADLLLSPTLGSVRQCADETCGWLFLDTTRNRSRRWCDMRGCGNRAKVRRHRARQRMDQDGPETATTAT